MGRHFRFRVCGAIVGGLASALHRPELGVCPWGGLALVASLLPAVGGSASAPAVELYEHQLAFAAGSTHDGLAARVVEARDLRRLATTTVLPGKGTLQTAYNEASSGDVLELQAGSYTGGSSEVLRTAGGGKEITIRAKFPNQAMPELDGEGERRVITVVGSSVVTFIGVAIIWGLSQYVHS